MTLVSIQIDLNQDNELSSGDLQLLLENEKIFAQLYDIQEPHLCTSLEDLFGVEEIATFEEIANVGSLTMEYSEGKTQVEFSFSDQYLKELMEEYGVPGELNDILQLLGTGKINYGIFTKNKDQAFSAYPSSSPFNPDPENLDCAWLGQYPVLSFEFDFFVPESFETDIAIDHIEVTQTIQTETNDMPLAKNKPTLARVFVDNPLTNSITVNVKLTGYAVLGIEKEFEGDFIPDYGNVEYVNLGTIQQDFTAPQIFSRNDLEDSANFELPAYWISQHVIILTAEVEIIGLWTDTDSYNNFCTEIFAFHETHDMNIYYLRVNEGTEEEPELVTDEFVESQLDALRISYPMANPNFIELDWSTLGVFSGDSSELLLELTDIAYNIILAYLFSLAFGHTPPFPLPDQVFGMVSWGGGCSSPSWYENGPSFAAWGGRGSSGELVLAHEINHNIGPGNIPDDGPEAWGQHVSDYPAWNYGCGAKGPDQVWQSLYNDGDIHEPGWYPGATEMVPATTPDLMTYCPSYYFPTKWISDYRWVRLFERLYYWEPAQPSYADVSLRSVEHLLKTNQGVNTLNPTTSAETIRIIQGVLYNDSTAELHPSYTFTVDSWSSSDYPSIGSWSTPEEEALANLQVHYLNGTQESYPIWTSFISAEFENMTQYGFTLVLPDNGEITEIALLDSNDEVIDHLNITGFEVTDASITGPSEILRDTLTEIQWDLTLVNSTNIYAQLQYSPDGEWWYPLGEPTTTNTAHVLFSTLPGSDNGQMRLLLTDGVQTEIVEGYNFTLAKLPPTVEISSTMPAQLVMGSRLSLKAIGKDPETGPIANTSLSWKITKGGTTINEFTGSCITTQFSETGIYEISVTAVDPDGIEATDSVQIEVISTEYLDEETWTEFQEEVSKNRSGLITFMVFPVAMIFTTLLIVNIVIRCSNKRPKE